jgi:hypothetical protein
MRIRARGKKANPVAWPRVHRAGSGRDIFYLIVIRHGFGSFRCWCVTMACVRMMLQNAVMPNEDKLDDC